MEIVQFIPQYQRRLVFLASQADSAPVLVYGPNGSGKSALAQWIHNNSQRSTLPYVIAKKDIPLSEQIPTAHGGTFLLPEIGEWPLAEQKILSRLLETKAIPHPQHNSMSMVLNVRLMATTSQALEGRAQAGLFNFEFLQKLNVFRIEMPPLHKRTDEFTEIVIGLTQEITHELHKEHIRTLSNSVWEKLKSYDWPGNLRELRNVLRVAIVSAKDDQLEESDLPDFGHHRVDFRKTREEFEKVYLLELLKTFDWQIETTCKVSRIDKNTLLSKMQKYGIFKPGVSVP